MKLCNTHGFKFWEWVIASPSQKARMIAIERRVKDMESGEWLKQIRKNNELEIRWENDITEMKAHIKRKMLEHNRRAGIQ